MASWWIKFKATIFINLGVYFIYIFLWIIFLTCKKTYSNNKLPQDGSVVVFWHDRLAFMSFAYLRYWKRDFSGKKHGKVIISDHKDGEIIARIINFFGIGTLRGSSSKGGVRVLINALKDIKNGIDVIITPDGPRGPRHSVADGAVVIAQKTNSQIYALNYETTSFWQLKSWDKMIVPKPFSTINFTLSEPFSVKNLSLKEAKEKIQTQLWCESEKNNGQSKMEHENEFIVNLKAWWTKNERKNPVLDDELREILDNQKI